MEIYHVTEESPEWLYKAYDYIRTDAFCFGQSIPIEVEFSHDSPRKEFQTVILIEDHKPIAGCRVAFPAKEVGKIERVCVIREKQKGGYGRILIEDAEKWILESGAKHIVINSQDRAAGFYHKLGYATNYEVSPSVYEKHHQKKIEDEKSVNDEKAENDEKNEHRKSLGFTCVLVEKFF